MHTPTRSVCVRDCDMWWALIWDFRVCRPAASNSAAVSSELSNSSVKLAESEAAAATAEELKPLNINSYSKMYTALAWLPIKLKCCVFANHLEARSPGIPVLLLVLVLGRSMHTNFKLQLDKQSVLAGANIGSLTQKFYALKERLTPGKPRWERGGKSQFSPKSDVS